LVLAASTFECSELVNWLSFSYDENHNYFILQLPAQAKVYSTFNVLLKAIYGNQKL
jgi:hypothetical protein